MSIYLYKLLWDVRFYFSGSPGFFHLPTPDPAYHSSNGSEHLTRIPMDAKSWKKNSSIIGKTLWKLGFWVNKSKLPIKQSNLKNLILYPHSLLGQTRFAALSFDLGLPYLPRLAAVLVLELGYCLGNSQESQLPLELIDIVCWWLFFGWWRLWLWYLFQNHKVG